jgi:acetate---CoA ligase (ADP-forming)
MFASLTSSATHSLQTLAHPLQTLMAPRSVAVIGASARTGALGNTVVRNLQKFGFSGRIFPIHPREPEICGLAAYPKLSALDESPECAVVCLPAESVLAALDEAAAHGVGASVIFASGFAEAGEAGRSLQSELRAFAERTKMKVCGPNCLGIANVTSNISLYSADLPEGLQKGDVAVLSHSGSGCIVLSNLGRFGVSHLVSIGNGAIVDVDQYLDFLAGDEATRVAALFLETVRDPAAFAAAAHRMRQAGKAVVALKVGRSEKGSAATAAHTGSLSGTAAVYDDFFKSCGVLVVEDLDELVEAVELVRLVRSVPRGAGVAVLNVSGGEIALTCDIAQRIGLELPELSPDTRERLGTMLPSFARASNPLDATGVAVFDMGVYGGCVQALADDPAVSLVAVAQDCPAGLGAQQAQTYRRIAETVAKLQPNATKPIVFYSNIAGGLHPHVTEPLRAVGAPALQGARASLLAIKKFLDSKPPKPAENKTIDTDRRWFERLATGAPFTERESKLFLAGAGLPITREELASSAAQARTVATSLTFPVALKIESIDLPHKTEVGGVALNLSSADAVEEAYAAMMRKVTEKAPNARINGVLVQEMVTSGVEIIAGVSRAEPFGMSVVVGAGGILVELMRDVALALAPISHERALQLIGETKVSKILEGYRGSSKADISALADTLERLSRIAVAYRDVLEAIDLNPVHVGKHGEGVRIVDALVVPRATQSL